MILKSFNHLGLSDYHNSWLTIASVGIQVEFCGILSPLKEIIYKTEGYKIRIRRVIKDSQAGNEAEEPILPADRI